MLVEKRERKISVLMPNSTWRRILKLILKEQCKSINCIQVMQTMDLDGLF